MLGLAVLVFAWGLQYKISLDEGPHAFARHMVEAKLLSGDDLGVASKDVAAILPTDLDKLPPAAPLALIFLSFLAASLWDASPRLAHLKRARVSPWRKLEYATSVANFFRPPPAL